MYEKIKSCQLMQKLTTAQWRKKVYNIASEDGDLLQLLQILSLNVLCW
jgi:hypothetical protein